MQLPEFWMVAGPNGAGKTTCVQKEPISQLLPQVTFLNPDDRALAKLRALGFAGFADAPFDIQTRVFFESADEVFADLERALAHRDAAGVETVLSTEKYQSLVTSVLGQQGFVGLIYIALASPFLAKERVAARVQRGGHGIPDDKIEQRWQRSLNNLGWFAAHATAFWVFDNSDSNPANSPPLIAYGKLGVLEFVDSTTFPELKTALASLPKG